MPRTPASRPDGWARSAVARAAAVAVAASALATVGLAQPAQADISVGAPVLDLKFENNVTDSSAAPHTTSLKGGGTATYVDGIAAGTKAIKLGANTYLDLGTSTALQPSSLTSSFWIKPDTAMSGEQVFTWNKSVYNSEGWYLTSNASNNPLVLSIGTGSPQPYEIRVTATDRAAFFPVGEWTHVAVTFDASTKTAVFYRNGVKVESRVVTPVSAGSPGAINANASLPKTIGFNGPNYNGAYLTTALDDYQLYPKVATADDVVALYQARGTAIQTAPSVTISDLTSNGFARPSSTLTVTGSGAKLEYRFASDGAWQTFTSPVTLPAGTTVVEARSTGTNGAVSTTTSQPVKIDAAAPVVTSSTSGRTVTLTATDTNGSGVDTLEQSVDGSPFAAYTGPITVDNAAHTISYRATDLAGNTSATGSTALADTNPSAAPAVTISELTSNGFARPSSQLTVTGSGAKLEYRFSTDGAWQTFTSPVTLPAGTTLVEARSTGSNGVVSPTTSRAVKIDAAAPVVSSSTSGRTVTLTATDTDGSGVGSIEQRIDSGAFTTYAGPITVDNAAHTISYRATDLAGNTSATGTTTLADVTPPAAPAVAISNLTSNGFARPSSQLTVTGSGAKLEYRFATDGAWQTFTAPVTLPAGTTLVEARSTGTNGVVGPTTSQAVKIDATAPVVTSSTSGRTVTLTATDTNGSGVSLLEQRIDSGAFTTYAGPITVDNAAHTISYRATDLAGNLSATGSTTLADATAPAAPTVTISNLTGNGFARPSSTLVVAGSGAKLEYRFSSTGAWVTYTGPVALPAGTTLAEARSTGTNGVVSSTTSQAVKIDATAPVVTATATGRTVTLTATDTNGSGVSLLERRVDGGAWTAYAGPVTLDDKAHLVEHRATDLAGNQSAVGSVTLAAVPVVGPVVPPVVTPAVVAPAAKATTSLAAKVKRSRKVRVGDVVVVEVTAAAPGTTPTGVVKVRLRGATLGSATLENGVARLRFELDKPGKSTLLVGYAGSATATPAATRTKVRVARG